jgi:hypothetical protein
MPWDFIQKRDPAFGGNLQTGGDVHGTWCRKDSQQFPGSWKKITFGGALIHKIWYLAQS